MCLFRSKEPKLSSDEQLEIDAVSKISDWLQGYKDRVRNLILSNSLNDIVKALESSKSNDNGFFSYFEPCESFSIGLTPNRRDIEAFCVQLCGRDSYIEAVSFDYPQNSIHLIYNNKSIRDTAELFCCNYEKFPTLRKKMVKTIYDPWIRGYIIMKWPIIKEALENYYAKMPVEIKKRCEAMSTDAQKKRDALRNFKA